MSKLFLLVHESSDFLAVGIREAVDKVAGDVGGGQLDFLPLAKLDDEMVATITTLTGRMDQYRHRLGYAPELIPETALERIVYREVLHEIADK